MSFLILDEQEQFDGRTLGVSVWFRVPQDAIDAVRTRDAVTLNDNEEVKVMDHIIPIMMCGPQKMIPVENWTFPNAECFNDPDPEHPPSRTTLGYIADVRQMPSQQTCIGIRCHPGGNGLKPLPPSLFVHVQPSNGPKVPPLYRVESGPGFSCPVYPDSDPVWGFHPIPVFTDASYIRERPLAGAVGNSSLSGTSVLPGDAFGGKPEITPDHWHHLLLSWKLGTERSKSMSVAEFFDVGYQGIPGRISTASQMHCVLDGVDKNRFDLPATWVGSFSSSGAGIDPNAIVCGEVFDNATGIYDPDRVNVATRQPQTVDVVTMNYTSVLTSPLWIPGSNKVKTQKRGIIKANQHIELGELQIFNRLLTKRDIGLFLDDEGKPVKPQKARDRLGEPELLLHRSGSWIKGRNTGRDGDMHPLTPKGEIKRYKPDPSLYGPQKPKDK